VTRADEERSSFRSATDTEVYLRANSHLPGPRSNLELLSAAAEEVDESWAQSWADRVVGEDPTDVFVISVALVALGRFVAAGSAGNVELLRRRAADGEWRIREAVAIGLQRLGDDRPDELAVIAREWSESGDALVARAAVAAVAEPRLLRTHAAVDAALDVMDAATRLIVGHVNRRDDRVRVLRQALGYAWSVVVAADVARVWPSFVELARSTDPDVQRIVRENLKKNRLVRLGLEIPTSAH
jgi:hypothetical protein